MDDKYYVWSELAALTDDNELRIGLLAKALMAEKDEKFLGRIHLNLAKELAEKGLMAEAMRELETYRSNHEKSSSEYDDLLRCVGTDTPPAKDNAGIYADYAAKAEEYAYAFIPPTSLIFGR